MARPKTVIPLDSDIEGGEYQQINRDHWRRGVCICNVAGARTQNPSASEIAFHGTQRVRAEDNFTLGIYPYNPSKSIYDRMRLFWAVSTDGAAAAPFLQYSLDSGSTFTSAADTVAGEPTMSTPGDLQTQTDTGATDVDLSGIEFFEWLVFRLTGADANSRNASWFFQAMLFKLGEEPF